MAGGPLQVVLVTPNEADRAVGAGILAEHGAQVATCGTVADAVAWVLPGTGCLVLVEEALEEGAMPALREALAAQPAWSELPLVLVAAHDTPLTALAERFFPASGGITLLQRPLHPLSLVSAVTMALRARSRQHQVRELLEERSLALRQRDEFLAMLAHELRNPLAPIRNAAYLLRGLGIPDPMFERCRAMIEKQAVHITRLVDDLLDVSRLELAKVELRMQPLDLNQSVAAAVDACLPVTSARRHQVEMRLAPEPLGILADPVRVEQVVGNLLVNAAKFTPAGGAITVETRSEAGMALVAVTDNGRGIRPEMLASVFELFVQAEPSSARSDGGLGIGLTLVKRLVELHGGSVRAASDGLGKGSRFEALFPAAEALSGEGATAVARVAPARRAKRVLIVEDVPDVRESLGLLVGTWNHEVSYASSGTEGLERARQSQPDLAIIDIGLPELDGYQVARGIRAGPQPWARTVKLLALTGYGQANDRDRALQAGFDEHLLKPVDPQVLRGLLLD